MIRRPPRSTLDRSSAASDVYKRQILEWYDQLGKLKYISLRYFNVCGASDDGVLGDAKRETFGLMQNAIKGALGLKQFELNYQKVSTPDGSPVRDYINVVDLADAHVKAYEYLVKNDKSEVFNLGTGTGNSVLQVINAVSYTHLRAHETVLDLVCRLLLETKKKKNILTHILLYTYITNMHPSTIL